MPASARVRIPFARALLAAGLIACGAAAAAGSANGALVHKDRNVALKYAYLVRGPDVVDGRTIIRSLVLSAQDIEAKLKGCAVSSCVAGVVTEGLIVDLISGPRLGVSMAINNGLVQYSGTLKPAALRLTSDGDDRLAGQLEFDKTGSGGPRVEAGFDATLVKAFTAAR